MPTIPPTPFTVTRPRVRALAQPAAARLRRPSLRGDTCQFATLETRQLLASDFAVSFDNDEVRIPAIIVPGDRFLSETSITAPIRITNNGPMDGEGRVNIAFYLSADNTLNPSVDTLIRSFDNLEISLATSGDDAVGTFEPDMRIPASAVPGTYFLLVRIVTSSAIGDSNTNNDINISPRSFELRRAFGTVGTRNNVTTTVRANDGTVVAIGLSGSGSGTVNINSAGAFEIATTGTNQSSDLSITTSTGSTTGASNGINLASLDIDAAIRDVVAPTTNIVASTTLDLGSSFRNLTFNDVAGFTFNVPAAAARTDGAAPSFTFGNVTNASIISELGLAKVQVGSWLDTDADADRLTAPFVTSLISAGNVEFDMLLAGPAPAGGFVLGSAAINGVLKEGDWVIRGTGDSFRFNASTVNFAATFSDRLNTLASNTGTIRGLFTARNFTTISSAKNIVATTILAGTFLGDDARPGGTGGDADTFNPGQINALNVANGVSNTTIAAGLRTIPGTTANPAPQELLGGTTSRINAITIAAGAGSANRFLANRYGTVSINRAVIANPLADVRFQLNTLPPLAATSTQVGTQVSSSRATITITFTSYNLMALSTVTAGGLLITGPNGFAQPVTLISRVFVSGTSQGAVRAVFTLAGPAWTPAENGTYSITLQNPLPRDARNNFMSPGTIGTFDVAV
jgi:hypothetical protein